MRKYLIFLYSLVGYILSILTLSFLILWVYPWEFMSYYIDKPIVLLDTNAIIVDISLLLLFALQHSIMARSFFKDGLFSNVSDAVKASSYSVASSVCLLAIFYFWQPLEGYVWSFESGFLFWSLTCVYVCSWLIAFLATFVIDHFELFGLHQGYRLLKNIPQKESPFKIAYFYKYVRHPIQAGTLLGLWATPSMSYTHLLLSVGMSVYIFIGLYFEERSLVSLFGKEYEEYKKSTPMIFPLFR